MRLTVTLIFCAVCAVTALGQGLEDWIEQTEHPDDLHEWIEELRRAPLELNAATREQIAALPLFDRQSAQNIVTRREQFGGFRSLKDVLADATLTDDQRQVVRELTTVAWPSIIAPPKMRSYVTMEQRGANNGEALLAKSAARLQALLSSGLQSGYVYARRQADDADAIHQAAVGIEIRPADMNGRLLAGDFQYEAGTGLVFASAFGMANWLSAPYSVQPEDARGLVLRPSSDRRVLLHGGAVSYSTDWVDAALLGSVTKLDAAINDGIVERITEGQPASSELAKARRDQLRETLAGFSVAAKRKNLRVGTSSYYAQFSPGLAGNQDDVFGLRGDHLRIGSVFAQAQTSNVTATGELAASNPGGNAWQAAVAWNREPLGLSAWHVHAAANFYSPRSQVWGGYGAQANNLDATGIRVRTTGTRHVLWLSASMERTPFRTSQSPLTLSSSDLEIRWNVHLSTVMDGEMLAGRSRREETANNAPTRDVQVDRLRSEIRFSGQEEFKIRLEWRAAAGAGLHQTGSLLFVQGKTRVGGLDVYGRLTYFNLDGGEINTAVYENSLTGSYPLISLAGRGTREAIMIGRQWSTIAVTAKMAMTERSGIDTDKRSTDAALTVSIRP